MSKQPTTAELRQRIEISRVGSEVKQCAIEVCNRLEAAELKLAMYEGFDTATEDGFFEPPHPVFMLVEENDKLKSTIKAISELQRYTIAAGLTGKGGVSQSVKNDINGAYVSAIDLQALIKDQS